MPKPKFNRIASYDSFPLEERLYMRLNMKEKTLHTFKEGRDATDGEVGDALWNYHQALYKAERQIEALLKIFRAIEADEEEAEDYLEHFPDLEEGSAHYRISEIKECLFMAMAKGEEKEISKYINQLSILEVKQGKEESHA